MTLDEAIIREKKHTEDNERLAKIPSKRGTGGFGSTGK